MDNSNWFHEIPTFAGNRRFDIVNDNFIGFKRLWSFEASFDLLFYFYIVIYFIHEYLF